MFSMFLQYCLQFYKNIILLLAKLKCACWLSQHEASRAAFEDAHRQMDNILGRIETKTATIAKLQNDIEKHKFEASEARKVEQVCILLMSSNLCPLYLFIFWQLFPWQDIVRKLLYFLGVHPRTRSIDSNRTGCKTEGCRTSISC